MDKKALSERDICTKFITPALRAAGWDEVSQIREEVPFTKGRIIVRGKLVSRGQGKRADYTGKALRSLAGRYHPEPAGFIEAVQLRMAAHVRGGAR